MSVYAVIMAGGSGTRFYPMSRQNLPKQFLPLFSQNPMILETFERILPLIPKHRILLSTNESLKELSLSTLKDLLEENLVLEPDMRNTGPALGLIALEAMRRDPDAILVSLHSDHRIIKESRFLSVIQSACDLASQDVIVTLGIKPQYPETGYGYIEAGKVIEVSGSNALHPHHEVISFKEKPDLKTAKEYIKKGSFYWNAGMFIFKASHLLEEIKLHASDLYHGLMKLQVLMDQKNSVEFREAFLALPSVPIDVCVMERSSRVVVIPCDIGWSDVGSFSSLYDLHEKDENHNAMVAQQLSSLQSVNSEKNLVVCRNPGKSVCLLGVSDLMVVDTEDVLLVGRLQDCQDVKKFVPRS